MFASSWHSDAKYWNKGQRIVACRRAETSPKISIVVPTKNEQLNIFDCLKAIFSQTLYPYEVIVVDGNSNDRTVEIAKEFQAKVLYEDHGTVGGARQVGLENAKGEYIAFTDADCIPDEHWLENLVVELEPHTNMAVLGVGGRTLYIGKGLFGKSVALIMNTFLGSANSLQGRQFVEKRYVRSISACNSIYRKDALVEIGGFDVSLSVSEETELNKRLSKKGKLLYIPTAKVFHKTKAQLMSFARQMYEFGYGRGKLRLWELQCIPPVVAVLAVLSLAFSYWILPFMLFSYFLVLMIMAFKFILQQRDVRYLGSIPIAYIIEHTAYTLGFWRGIIGSCRDLA